MKRLCALIALSTVLAGCETIRSSSLFQPRSSTATAATSTASAPVSSAPLAATPASATTSAPIDPPATRDARVLLETDRQLGANAQDRGLGVALAGYADLNTLVLTPAGSFKGVDQITRGLASSANAGPLYWQPEEASVAGSNDFGQTTGRYVQVLRGAEAVQGRYITVWRKDAGGVWRVSSNVIMPNPPAPAAARRR